MTINDIALGLRLTRQAGWNQTESDWLRFVNLEPEGCFVAELNECPVGTTVTCVFDQVAWIAMVLVDKEARRKGVGTKLLKHSLEYLEARQAKTIRLDATLAGQPIYEKLGFVTEYELARFEGTAAPGRTEPEISEATPIVFEDIIELDLRMTGTNRAKLLSSLFREFPENIRLLIEGGKINGFITMRPGANAVQIGPCLANVNAGPALLSDAFNRCAGRQVFVDVPTGNLEAVKIAESGGLRIQRCFQRMYRGEQIKDNIKTLWASSGPEKG